ncbi:MAG: hypothetical protein RLZZ519_156 [Bacteroidota bacterium]|jgi:NAD(P)H dehydrogenase (quinone)
MKMKKIVLLLGHPNNESFCAALANEYERGAIDAAAEIRVHRLGEMQFDPSLHLGFNSKQVLEPDLVAFQNDLQWADHFVLVLPLWWGGMPGALKGLIDRVFLPGFAFKYQEGSPFPKKLLQGKSARVLLTMDSPNFWYKWVLGQPLTKALKRQILGFSGFKPVSFSLFGNVRSSSLEKRKQWLEAARKLGEKQL